MSKFKQKLRMRIILSLLAAVGAAAVFFTIYYATGGMGKLPDFIQGFQVGIFTAVEIVSVLQALFTLLALRNEEKMKKLYIKETDERTILITQKSGSSSFLILTFGLLLATITAGFFSETVFFTLLAAVAFIELVRILAALYYKRKLS